MQRSRTVPWNVEEGVQQGAVRAEPRTGADALQLTLRFSFRARLTASVRCPRDTDVRPGKRIDQRTSPESAAEHEERGRKRAQPATREQSILASGNKTHERRGLYGRISHTGRHHATW